MSLPGTGGPPPERRSDGTAPERRGYRGFDTLSRPYRPDFASPGGGSGLPKPPGRLSGDPLGLDPLEAGAGGRPAARARGATFLVLAVGAALGLLLATAVLSLEPGPGMPAALQPVIALAAGFGPLLSGLLALRLLRALSGPAEAGLGAGGSAEAAAEAANGAPEAMAVTDRDGALLFANRRMRRLVPGIMAPGVRLPDFLAEPSGAGTEAIDPDRGRRVALADGRAAWLRRHALPHPEGRQLWRLQLEEAAPLDGLLRLAAALEAEPGLSLRLSLADPGGEGAGAATAGDRILWRELPASGGAMPARAAGFPAPRGGARIWLVAEQAAGAAAPALPSGLAEASVGAALLEPSGLVLAANAAFAEMTGWNGEGPQALADLVADGEREALAQALAPEAVLPGAAPATLRFRCHQERSVHLYLSPLDGAAPAGRRLALLIDVTQQKGVEQQFAHSQKMQAIGQLAGGVAHDFNNLLTAMIGFCDLLLQRHPPTDQSFADVQQIKQNALRAAGLVRQLLAFSRRQTLRPRPLDVTDVLADLRHLLSRLIGERIQLKIVHGRDLGIVRVDRGQLEQVIINLAVNARDAMRDGGTLTIATAAETVAAPLDRGSDSIPPGRYVRIDVADTGTGVPPEHADKIFDPFFTTKKPGEGTGLGLSTVYGIIRQTGGFVFLDRNGPDGATFSILLPEAAPEARREAEAAPEEVVHRDLTGRETLLLVEDEDAVRLFAARSLRNKGYTVMEAPSGEAALELSRRFDGPIHALVTDVVMPNMDGPTLAQEILKDRPGLSVVFMSGYAEDAVRQTLSGGDLAASFLQKPFTLNDLAMTVRAALGGGDSTEWRGRG